MSDLFTYEDENEREREVQERVQRELDKKLKDPKYMIKLYEKRVKELEERERELKPKARKYEQFLDAEGYVSVSDVAAILKLKYITPSGQSREMGRNKLCILFVHDKIMYRNGTDYSLMKSLNDSGYGRTHVSEKNGHTVTSVHFTPKGIDWLIEKYNNDDRIFKSDGQGDLHVFRKE